MRLTSVFTALILIVSAAAHADQPAASVSVKTRCRRAVDPARFVQKPGPNKPIPKTDPEPIPKNDPVPAPKPSTPSITPTPSRTTSTAVAPTTAAKPTTSAAKPTTAAPTTSAAKPTTSAAKPTTSAAKPTTSIKPSTTAIRPTTSASRASPSPSPSPRASPSPLPPRKDGDSGLSSFDQDCLNSHNYYRSLVGSRPVSWSRVAASTALSWSQHLYNTGRFEHSVTNFGENLYKSSGDFTCSHAIQLFFSEYKNYHGEIVGQGNFNSYGHYTQVIWPSTTEIGCGRYGGYLTCHYNPPGNYPQRVPVYRPDAALLLSPLPDGPALVIDNGVALAFILFVSQIVNSAGSEMQMLLYQFNQTRLRAALVGAAYRKSMRLSPKTQSEFSAGLINSFIVSDVDSVTGLIRFINDFWSTPATVVISIVLLVNFLGHIAWISIGTIILMSFLQSVSISPLTKYGRIGAQIMDRRTKALREFLYGIKIIKYHAIEEYFLSKISAVRKEQIANWRIRMNFLVTLFCFSNTHQFVVQVVTFAAYAALGGNMRADIIFPALSLISSVNELIGSMPNLVLGMQSYVVSYRRLADYLVADEIKPDEVTGLQTAVESPNGAAVSMNGASFTWEEVKGGEDETDKPSQPTLVVSPPSGSPGFSESQTALTLLESNKPAPFALHDITLEIPRGSLVAVVGSVGSGKSSLLSALIGSMRKTAGNSALFGSVAYCAQEPWILTGTIEDNIVFGSDAVRARIPAAVAAACLDRDLEILPNGLGTQIGEKGINLSGGQKARVALARAIARDADIYLLDDPIAALDAHVGKKVFDDAICGVLRGKTVVLVTHQLHLLPKVDMVVVLDEGRVAETGAFRELMAREDGVLAEIMKDYHFDDLDAEDEAIKAEQLRKEEQADENVLVQAVKQFEEEKAVEEDRRTGAVRFSDYLSFFTAAGALFLPALLLLGLLIVAANALAQIVLAVWSSPDNMPWGFDKGKALLFYVVFNVGAVVLFMISCFVIFEGAVRAGMSFHDRSMNALARAPMNFYDGQPVGRILNRMTADLRNVENILPQAIINSMRSLSGVVTGVVVIAVSTPYLMIEFVIVAAVALAVMPFYQATYRELKRLSSTLASPLSAHISESLNGISTIKAYSAQELFIAAQERKMDGSNVSDLVMEGVEAWLSIRMSLLGSTVSLVLVLLAASGLVSKTTIGASLVATITFTGNLNLAIFVASHLSSNFNSVERLNHYAKELPSEAARELPMDPKDGAWPTAGAVAISSLEIRYPSRPDHAVIQDLSLDIQPGEKVGVVGRTGSGKSTLMTALFRIMEASKGSIAIDGIDIASLGLKTLRSRLQIIPQDPVLFRGTVRSNLDFASKYSDDELWAALGLVGLKDFVGSLDGKLDAAIEENGANLSMGQRQLMCLCKAILAKPKVLIMDEATASVDAEADKRIQESIETQFAATSVLSIAHRLNTIAAFDRVLVLDGGRIAEFDAPHVLLGRAGSVFGDMVEATGAANAAVIRQIAAEHFAASR
nr:Multidrug resistance-associated protein 1 [Polyrhizophydium stewartii]